MVEVEEKIKELQAQIIGLQNRVTDIEETHKDQLSMIVMSGDMDKILATMVVAVGAAAMDTEVKLFFTFWSIAALRDPKKKIKGKSSVAKMFGRMLPKGRNDLKLSKMNMGGYGPKMMKKLMKKQKVFSLDEFFEQAGELGIEIVICEMSMDLMGFKKE
ncbi:hypothetical protein MNBD_BACTEROID07-663, partial [hydrothermal vent metagenome]